MNVDKLALSTVDAIFQDIRGRGLLKWLFDPRGAENLIGHFDDGEELRGIDLDVQGQIKAAWQVIIADTITRFQSKLTLEQRGAYTIILDMIYIEGGPIDRNERWLADELNCSVRKAKALFDELIALRMIYITPGGKLTNHRAGTEIEETTASDCEYCVDGLQADGETPCPCRGVETPAPASATRSLAAKGLTDAGRVAMREAEPARDDAAIRALIQSAPHDAEGKE